MTTGWPQNQQDLRWPYAEDEDSSPRNQLDADRPRGARSGDATARRDFDFGEDHPSAPLPGGALTFDREKRPRGRFGRGRSRDADRLGSDGRGPSDDADYDWIRYLGEAGPAQGTGRRHASPAPGPSLPPRPMVAPSADRPPLTGTGPERRRESRHSAVPQADFGQPGTSHFDSPRQADPRHMDPRHMDPRQADAREPDAYQPDDPRRARRHGSIRRPRSEGRREAAQPAPAEPDPLVRERLSDNEARVLRGRGQAQPGVSGLSRPWPAHPGSAQPAPGEVWPALPDHTQPGPAQSQPMQRPHALSQPAQARMAPPAPPGSRYPAAPAPTATPGPVPGADGAEGWTDRPSASPALSPPAEPSGLTTRSVRHGRAAREGRRDRAAKRSAKAAKQQAARRDPQTSQTQTQVSAGSLAGSTQTASSAVGSTAGAVAAAAVAAGAVAVAPGAVRETTRRERVKPNRKSRREGGTATRTGRRRGLRHPILVATGSALALGAVAAFATEMVLGGNGPAHQVSTPGRLMGYEQQPALAQGMGAAHLRAEIVKESNGEASHVVDAVYEDSTGPAAKSGPLIILFIGGNLSGSASSFISSFTGLVPGSFATGAGSLGGQAACVPGSAGHPAECAWADNDTFGLISSPNLTAAALGRELRAMRPLMEHVVK